jgi:hypothetical protein
VVARALDAPQVGLDLHCDDIARFDTWKRCQRRATWRTVFGRRAHIMHGNDHGQTGTITAAVSLRTGLLASLSGRGRLGLAQSLGTRGLLALFSVEAVGEVASRRFKRFPLRLQGRFAWHQACVLGPPVVGFPLERARVLLRQYHGLLGEGRGMLAAHWDIRPSGNEWWLSRFQKLRL